MLRVVPWRFVFIAKAKIDCYVLADLPVIADIHTEEIGNRDGCRTADHLRLSVQCSQQERSKRIPGFCQIRIIECVRSECLGKVELICVGHICWSRTAA